MTHKMSLYCLLWLLSIAVFAQNDKDAVKLTFNEYFKTVEQQDNLKTLEFIYPKLYNHIPKQEILQALDNMKSDTTKSITMKDGIVTSISEDLEIKGVKYALVKYAFKMIMTFKPEKTKLAGRAAVGNNYADYTYEILKEQYGDKNVTYNREKIQMVINGTDEMYAINDPAYHEWKFLENKNNLIPVLEKILPRKVLDVL